MLTLTSVSNHETGVLNQYQEFTSPFHELTYPAPDNALMQHTDISIKCNKNPPTEQKLLKYCQHGLAETQKQQPKACNVQKCNRNQEIIFKNETKLTKLTGRLADCWLLRLRTIGTCFSIRL